MTTPVAATRERYDQLRAVSASLHARMNANIGKPALVETAKSLGLWRFGQLDFPHEIAVTAFRDCLLHDYAPSRVTAVARFAARNERARSDDERRVLNGYLSARPTLFTVLERDVASSTTLVLDFLTDQELVLTDRALAENGDVDDIVVSRVMEIDGICMSTGSAVLVDGWVFDLLAEAGPLPESAWTPRARAAVSIALHRLALAYEAEIEELVDSMLARGTDPISRHLRESDALERVAAASRRAATRALVRSSR